MSPVPMRPISGRRHAPRRPDPVAEPGLVAGEHRGEEVADAGLDGHLRQRRGRAVIVHLHGRPAQGGRTAGERRSVRVVARRRRVQKKSDVDMGVSQGWSRGGGWAHVVTRALCEARFLRRMVIRKAFSWTIHT